MAQNLWIEVIEARDLLPLGTDSHSKAASEGLYVVVSLFDATGKRVDSHTTQHSKPVAPPAPPPTQPKNQAEPSAPSVWNEAFAFKIPEAECEGSLGIYIFDTRSYGQKMGHLRLPLSKITKTGTTEGWYFLEGARSSAASIHLKIAMLPTTADGMPLAGDSVERRPSSVSGVEDLLFQIPQQFWNISASTSIKDKSGTIAYRMKHMTTANVVKIENAMSNVIGEVKEHRLFRKWFCPPKYVIIVYGTIATMKKKWLHTGKKKDQVIIKVKGSNDILVKGCLPLYEYKLYHEMSPEPIAVVSKSLAPSGDSYGIRVRPTFPNPVLLLAACCAIDKMYHRQATILA